TKKSYVIGVVPKSTENPIFNPARIGAEAAAKELSTKYGVSIRVDWRGPVAENAQKQAEIIEQLVATGADGVAVTASDAKLLKTAIDSASGKGVAVVTFDSDVPDSKRLAYYGTDDFAAGKRTAAELVKSMGDKGTVAILAGNQNAPNLQTRVKGVREELKQHAGIKVLDTVYHEENPQAAVLKIEQVQAANPQITGWAFVGGWPLNTDKALDKIKGKAKVVSIDAMPAMLGYVKRGEVEVLLGQQVYGWGYESTKILVENLINGTTPKEAIIKADLEAVTKSNVDAYAKKWEEWMPTKK
ncbi:MAG: substrate-binding domain-containing protein, partial [Phycisphaerales bacterium]